MPGNTIALLLSTPSFEDFYGKGMGLTLEDYLARYRNDFSWYYCEMFLKHGRSPIIYIPSREHSGLHRVDNGVQVRMLPLAPWFAKLQKLPIWRSKYGRYAMETLNALAFRKGLNEAIRSDNVDILYAQEYWSGRFDRLASWFKAGTKPMLIGSDHGGTQSHHLMWFKRLAFKRCALLTSQTAPEFDEVKKLGGRTILLPNPVDVDFFSPAAPGTVVRSKTVITVARFNNTQKRTTDLIEAFRYLGDDWHLDIYGKGPDEPLLRETITRFKLEEKVTLKGFIGSRESLRDKYQNCAVFSLPSFNEAVAIVALEAMSCATPVVVTDIRAFETLITEGVNGLKVPVGNPQALATAIEKAHANAETLGNAARETVVRRHSFSHFMQVFDAAVARSGAQH